MKFTSLCKQEYIQIDVGTLLLTKDKLYEIKVITYDVNSPLSTEYKILNTNIKTGLVIFGERSFKDYFYTQEEMRDNRLNEILNLKIN